MMYLNPVEKHWASKSWEIWNPYAKSWKSVNLKFVENLDNAMSNHQKCKHLSQFITDLIYQEISCDLTCGEKERFNYIYEVTD